MKPDVKKIIITNLSYLLFVWLSGKLSEAWRLASGAILTQKMLHFMDSLAAVFANGRPASTPLTLYRYHGRGAGAAGGVHERQERREVPPRHGMQRRPVGCIISTVRHNTKTRKEGNAMTQYSKITALYSRLSVGNEDRDGGESNSIVNQDRICQG